MTQQIVPNDNTFLAPTVACTLGYAASMVIKGTGAGILYGISGYNSLASPQFILLFSSPTVPADTAVPDIIIAVPASSNFSLDFGVHGRVFSTGISVSNSTTGPTKTIGAANCSFDARFK
jgi:hypothetical protein